MPTHTPSERKKNVTRLGGSFGGMIGRAVSALTGKTKQPAKKPKKGRKASPRLTRQQELDRI